MFKELFTEGTQAPEDLISEIRSGLTNLTGKSFTSNRNGTIKSSKGVRGWKNKQLDLTYKVLKKMGAEIYGWAFGGALTIYFKYKGKNYQVQHGGPDGIGVWSTSDLPDNFLQATTEAEYYKQKGY